MTTPKLIDIASSQYVPAVTLVDSTGAVLSEIPVTLPLISGEDETNNLLRVREVGQGSNVFSYGDGTVGTGSTPTDLLWKITRTQYGVVQVQTYTWVANAFAASGYAVASISDWV